MAVVYRAVREDDFQQQVAIKIVKRGMDTDELLERFRHERQILAWLNHNNVARLLDGGATADNRPYLVMELVEGLPITEYCREKNLEEKLRLFLKVCSAVACAHRSLVIHSGFETGEYSDHWRRRAKAAGLWNCENVFAGVGRGCGADLGTASVIDARICESGAGSRRTHHRGDGYLCYGRGSLRIAHRREGASA